MSLSAPFAPSDASDASTASSSPARPPAFASDSDDPSFDLDHVQTSTPRKTGHGARYSLDRGDDCDEEDPLHASDTESLDLDDNDIDRGLRSRNAARTGSTPPLTRRSLLQLSQPRDDAPFAGPSTRDGPVRLAHSFRRDVRGNLYAPSPSTGSSTLVDREEDVTRKAGFVAAAGDDEVTLRRARIELSARRDVLVEEVEDDQGTVQPAVGGSDDGESSSPRPRRSRVGDLASYVDAKMSTSTPRRSPKHARLAPTTPAAPGAYPPSTRKAASLRPSSSFATASGTDLTQHPTAGSGGNPASQIHDAFSRLITGPDGALAHSAERRAALAAAVTGPSPARNDPPTPHPAGHYSFVPSTSLPVERSRRERRLRVETAEELDTPSRPTKLERALRHLSQAQREAADRAAAVEDFRSDDDEPLVKDEREPYAEYGLAGRSAIEFAMARSFHQEPHHARPEDASTEESLSDDGDLRASAARKRPAALRASQSVRFASPPPRRRSPSTSPARSPSPPHVSPPRRRSTTPPRAPPSPPLPPLPPPLEPDSPEPVRSRRPELMRRSHSSNSPPLASQPTLPSPVRRTTALSPRQQPSLAPSPPALPDPVHSPSPPRRIAREGWSRPASSTPPRGGRIPPPAPGGSPPPPLQLVDAAADRSTEDTVQALVSQLSAAVHALTAGRPVEEPVDARGLPRPLEREGKLRGEIERRRKESEGRWEEREREMRELELRGGSEADRRAEVLDQLAETYELEHELGYKVDELKRSIEGMGQLVGDQIAQALGKTLQVDTRRRSKWMLLALLTQLALFLFFLRLANSHSLALFQTVYHDPFAPPALFHLPAPFSPFLGSFAPAGEPLLSLETRATFSAYPLAPAAGAIAPLRLAKGVKDAVALVAQRWMPRAGAGAIVMRVPS